MTCDDDPSLRPFHDFTFLLCGLVYCWKCHEELAFKSTLPIGSGERYLEQACVLRDAGWVLRLRAFMAFCPDCAAELGFSMADADAT